VHPDFGLASGPGPVYPVGLRNGVLTLSNGPEFGGAYGGAKVLWVADASYAGPVLIRGGQLDATNPVRFWRGPNPAPHMQLPARDADNRWRDWPSYTRVRAAGCYFWQVDGLDVSYPVVFEVRRE